MHESAVVRHQIVHETSPGRPWPQDRTDRRRPELFGFPTTEAYAAAMASRRVLIAAARSARVFELT